MLQNTVTINIFIMCEHKQSTSCPQNYWRCI